MASVEQLISTRAPRGAGDDRKVSRAHGLRKSRSDGHGEPAALEVERSVEQHEHFEHAGEHGSWQRETPRTRMLYPGPRGSLGDRER
jgi:hypothetical protein